MDKEFSLEKVTLSKIVQELNNFFEFKKSGKPFNVSDVQSYIRRGYLPSYLGGQTIERIREDCGTKLYNIKN